MRNVDFAGIIETHGPRGSVDAVAAVDICEYISRIFCAAADGAYFVRAPAQRHTASSRDAAESGSQAGAATAYGGVDYGPIGFGADTKGDQACRRCGSRTGAAATRPCRQFPGVAGLTAEPYVIHCQFSQR